LVVEDATIASGTGTALLFQQGKVGQTLRFGSGLRVVGAARIMGTKIGGQVQVTGSTFSNREGIALSMQGTAVEGMVIFDHGFRAEGEVRLTYCQVSGQLLVADAKFEHPGAVALNLDGTHARGGLFLRSGFYCNGELRLSYAQVDHRLDISGAHLNNPNGYAMNASGIDVDGDIVFMDGFHSIGQVDVSFARISRNLHLSKSELSGNAGYGLGIEGVTVGGRFTMMQTSIRSDGGVAINGPVCKFSSGVALGPDFQALGEVNLLGMKCGVGFGAEGASVSNPRGVALRLDNSLVDGPMHFPAGFAADGAVRLQGSKISGQLSMSGCSLVSVVDHALSLEGATVGGQFVWLPRQAVGVFIFAGARVGGLRDAEESWPETAFWALDGFEYGRLTNTAPRSVSFRKRWLSRQEPYARSPYRELANAYLAVGEDRAARSVLIEEHNVLLHKSGSRLDRLYRWVTRVTIGHGYEPARALVIALALIVSTTAVISTQRSYLINRTPENSSLYIRATRPCTTGSPCLQPFVYAVDTVVPLVNFGQRTDWRLAGTAPLWLEVWLWSAEICGWALATLVGLGFTSIVRKT
jgi:hypothetical protein